MFWPLMSMALCAFLVVRLVFWTNEHRRESRWYYRVLLFLVTVYAANEVLHFLYNPLEPVSPWLALFHMALVYGAFIIKPQHLPWNGHHDTASKNLGATSDTTSRLRYGIRDTVLRRGKAAAAEREHGAITGSHRFP